MTVRRGWEQQKKAINHRAEEEEEEEGRRFTQRRRRPTKNLGQFSKRPVFLGGGLMLKDETEDQSEDGFRPRRGKKHEVRSAGGPRRVNNLLKYVD